MGLTFKGVSKRFDTSENAILKNIDLTIEPGEFVCIVGESGCGKSTLLNLAAGLEMPTEGHIYLDGKEVKSPSAERTVMFQEHGLYPWLSVIDNVKFGMKLEGIPKKEQEERALHYLDMVHLTEYKDYCIHQLSGGMRQRTALARALTINSKILLMDEPFSALDKQTSNRLREELQKIWMETKKTVLFITHSVEEAIYLADRVVVLSPRKNGVSDIIDVNLPRPREIYSNEFVELRKRILGEVRS
ncbi:MAG: ABC transporter ATP-binding protein [Ruminococcus sp.]|nr:ABC transporter ATP-binding protein [Ruminococcus sp.]